MKKKLFILLGIMVLLSAVGVFMINMSKDEVAKETTIQGEKLRIVTTFYPVYMIGLNLADHIDAIEVKSLTDLNTGCLHDYQLTTEDMKLISNADILIINGGGMEGFLEDVIANYPELKVIDASVDITLLANSEEDELDHEEEEEQENLDHDEEDEQEDLDYEQEATGQETLTLEGNEEEHEHGHYNSHVWLDPKLYVKQIENVRDELSRYMGEDKTGLSKLTNELEANAQNYIDSVLQLNAEIETLEESIKSGEEFEKAVIFHDAFAYLANRVGMTVAFTVSLDSDTSLSAGDIAEIIDVVKKENIKYLFTEQQYSDSIAKQIASETGAKVYIIDSAVTGDGTKGSYLNSMKKNIAVIKEAISETQK